MPRDVTTPRLTLRALRGGDAAALAALAASRRIAENLGRVPHPYALADAEEFIAFAATVPEPYRIFAICLGGPEGALIGTSGFDPKQPGGPGELGYWIGEAHWGRGFGTEAARATVAAAFEAGLSALSTGCRIGNDASRRILVGLGFELTGREMVFSRGQGREMEIERFHLTASRFAGLARGGQSGQTIEP